MKISMFKWKKLPIFLCTALVLNLTPAVSFAAEEQTGNTAESTEAQAYEELSKQLETQSQTATVDSSMDNDELFAGYVNELFYGNPEGDASASDAPKLQTSSLRQDQLEETDLAVYNALAKRIAEVASGEVVSTKFVIPASELFQDSYDAKDLKVNKVTENGEIIQEAYNAMTAKADFDITKILHSLAADAPYELYWFDKTKGIYAYYDKLDIEYLSNTTLGFSQDAKLVVCMAVSSDYKIGELDEKTQFYLNTDIDKTSAASAAAVYAESIINANQGLSDYEKICAYKEEICKLTSYNDTAAGDTTTPYGNPWQLIWVFDEDAETNVVCEGYSKAFQYLCDQSTWNSNYTDCITVTGTMAGGTGAGSHMWNVVTLDNDNYMADLTNSDKGSIGEDGELFLTGVTNGSGSSLGYTFLIGDADVSYEYDKNSIALYNENERTLNAEDFGIHNYTFSEWSWAKDYSSVRAVFKVDESDLTKTFPAKLTSTTAAATYDKTGKTTYTATVKLNGTTYTDTKEVTLPKIPLQEQSLSGTDSYTQAVSAGAFKLNIKSSVSGAGLTYTSSNPKFATVNASGQVTPVAAGTVTITVTASKAGYQTASKKITVTVTGLAKGKRGTFGSGTSKATYKVTGKDTVTFVKSKQSAKKATAINVPATVTIKGATYKVTAVGASAAKGFKKVKKVTIGKNVKTIGANAFAGETALKTMTINSADLTTLGKYFVKGDKKLTKITIKSKKLAASKCKKSLTGSYVKNVTVPKAVKTKYAKKIFIKKVCGRKVAVK